MKTPILYNQGMLLINCPNCFDLFNLDEEIDDKGTTAPFDTVIKYSKGHISEDIVCEKCDQTFSIKKIKAGKWESFIDN